MVSLGFTLVLSACATQSFKNIPAPPQLQGEYTPVVIADVDVLAMNARMIEFLERYVLEYEDPNIKRQLLSMALTNRAILGFHYNIERTLTANEAFNTRSGNCIAFANLFIAMAREAGLKARYHEVLIPPEWTSQNDTFVISKHINVVVDSPHGPFEVDISGREIKINAKRRIMSDQEAKSMYFNNLGAEELLVNNLSVAYAYLIKAIEIDPGASDSWSNLGVVLGRNGQKRDAEKAYLTALDISPDQLTAMGNLYDIYIMEENLAAAADLQSKVERYRQENPYYLLTLSDEALKNDQFRDSIRLLNLAIEKKDTEHLLHFAMAKTQYLYGNTVEAETSLLRARELAPKDIKENYSRPLHELVEENTSESLN
jgi:Flp pilus assembly protein TadD